MRRWAPITASSTVAAILMGCSAPVLGPQADISFLRNPTAPIATQVDVAAADLDGTWFVRQGAGPIWPIPLGRADITTQDTSLRLTQPQGVCSRPGQCLEKELLFDFIAGLPGRWAAADPDGARGAGLPSAIWVLWMDFDRRTVALGDPDGTFVAILDRAPSGGSDRITAAREILDWYGYDLGQLAEQ